VYLGAGPEEGGGGAMDPIVGAGPDVTPCFEGMGATGNELSGAGPEVAPPCFVGMGPACGASPVATAACIGRQLPYCSEYVPVLCGAGPVAAAPCFGGKS